MALRHDGPRDAPRLPFFFFPFPFSSSNCTGVLITYGRMIMAYFPLWLLLMFPEPTLAFLGGLVVLLFWESGQCGPMSVWLLLPGLWKPIGTYPLTVCIIEVLYLPLPMALDSAGLHPILFQQPLSPASLIGTNCQQQSTNPRSQLRDWIHPVQTHVHLRGQMPLQLLKRNFTYAHKASSNST